MKKSKLIKNILISSALVFLFFACTDPSDSPENVPLLPPSWIKAVMDDNRIRVEWERIADASSYKILRKDGNRDYEEIGEADSPVFYDENYSEEYVMNYVVKCWHWGGGWSWPSSPSNSVSLYIQNINASRLLYDDRIEVSWDEQSNAQSYNVYRYLSRTDPNPVVFEDIASTGFVDMYDGNDPESPGVNKPYYYRVTWNQEKNSRIFEYGLGGMFALGLYSTSIDYHEMNDDWSLLEDDPVSSVFSANQPPIVFCLDDGEKDYDWYKYYGPVKNIMLNINLPVGSQFTNELRFQFYTAFDDNYRDPAVIYQGYNFFDFSFSEYTGDLDEITDEQGNVSVYFRIYPESSTVNLIDFYFVEYM